jgi:hypothetical protein
MAVIQTRGTGLGFLVRGGITIGDIVHDEEVVFGPALNRAYHLEHDIAKYPRIVVDPEVVDEFGELPWFVVKEGGAIFIDPFTLPFMKLMMQNYGPVSQEEAIEIGVPAPRVMEQPPFDYIGLMRHWFERVKEEIRTPHEDKEYEKIAWLYDRIAKQLGVPPASSYPRIWPE